MTDKERVIFDKAKEVVNKGKILFGFDLSNPRTDETVFILIYMLAMANHVGRYKCSEELIDRILELRDFDDEDDMEFVKTRFDLYNRILSEGKVRADWKWSAKPSDSFQAALYLYGDLLLHRTYLENYENCPVVGMSVTERAEFIDKLEGEMFPAIIDFAALIKD